jgi:hypothetical protein
MSNVGANASDVGLIIQGTLIFLSACVAVVGYIIQSKLQAVAHEKELRLARVEKHKEIKLKQLRESLTNVIGPMQALSQAGQGICHDFGLSVSENHDSVMTYWFATHGGQEKAMQFIAGQSGMFSSEPFLLAPILDAIKKNPESMLAKDYRSTMKRAVLQCFKPLASLLLQHMNSLNVPTREKFIEMFPALKGDPQLRKILIVTMIAWSSAMEELLEQWDLGNYSQLFPRHAQYPNALDFYLISMLDAVKDDIDKATAGTMAYNTVTQEEESSAIFDGLEEEKRKQQEKKKKLLLRKKNSSGGSSSKEEEEEKEEEEDNKEQEQQQSSTSKYVAVGAAAGAAVVAAVV